MSSALELRRGTYRDSVSLMQVSRSVSAVDGVTKALVAMATELNVGLLAGMGFETPDGAGPNDLIVAIRAEDEDALSRAKAVLETSLELSTGGGGGIGSAGGVPPRTIRTAAASGTDATLALISVPGPHAFAEAVDALEAGLDVLIFSDNVPVEQEIRLKDMGRERGLLVMGPDCGTALVGGVGLGFANTVRGGPIGIVAASGTGSQELMCLLHAAGSGVSHCLGVGGRDLSEAVGARSTLQALAMLDADPNTELIVVVSKPPADAVAAEVERYAATLGTPVQLAFLGQGRDDLTAAATKALAAIGHAGVEDRVWPAESPRAPRTGALRGLFCGGTLCDEAMIIAADRLGPVASNIPLRPEWALPADMHAAGHLMIDFGDDGLTAGRPHPMIDPSLRLERLAEELADPAAAVLLLDVVLGHGAHADPAADLAAVLRTAGPDAPVVLISLCGTDLDPQDLEAQARTLADAGAEVHLSNAEAARRAVAIVEGLDA
ncbi:FdrA family protein [Embleya hyalina]|uniref:Succinate--CoA ligase [ADP-forming] subunit alpha n=1 Tax=Embleya hyalina TaxID=516124 RepID=A0A401YZY0_9ACTN|nr:FdrA family protein [Embleya hyalina]GCE00118.1 succinate--CoA ligase [ADP-forming] subunit alpha [Embleya hyalina]